MICRCCSAVNFLGITWASPIKAMPAVSAERERATPRRRAGGDGAANQALAAAPCPVGRLAPVRRGRVAAMVITVRAVLRCHMQMVGLVTDSAVLVKPFLLLP